MALSARAGEMLAAAARGTGPSAGLIQMYQIREDGDVYSYCAAGDEVLQGRVAMSNGDASSQAIFQLLLSAAEELVDEGLAERPTREIRTTVVGVLSAYVPDFFNQDYRLTPAGIEAAKGLRDRA